MITIKELNNNVLNVCSCCTSHTSSRPKEIDEIMGGVVADKMFELQFIHRNVSSTINLCDECLKDLKNKIDEFIGA